MLANPYEVFHVPADASERSEPMGSRPKFWFERDGQRWLFKATRPEHGEDWAEVLSSELAGLLGLPHADYQLARWQDQRGVVTRNFQPVGFDLVHGNELLQRLDPDYPREGMRFVRTRKHTIARVSGALESIGAGLPIEWDAPAGVDRASQVFGGYLLLDAWIGNTDRHHENWAVLVRATDASVHLAPTFDHAASLGSHERDDQREQRLTTRDAGFTVDAYVRRPKARSALYVDDRELRAVPMLDAYRQWVQASPAEPWPNRLDAADGPRVDALLARIPDSAMSGPARAFAAAMLKANRERILRGE